MGLADRDHRGAATGRSKRPAQRPADDDPPATNDDRGLDIRHGATGQDRANGLRERVALGLAHEDCRTGPAEELGRRGRAEAATGTVHVGDPAAVIQEGRRRIAGVHEPMEDGVARRRHDGLGRRGGGQARPPGEGMPASWTCPWRSVMGCSGHPEEDHARAWTVRVAVPAYGRLMARGLPRRRVSCMIRDARGRVPPGRRAVPVARGFPRWPTPPSARASRGHGRCGMAMARSCSPRGCRGPRPGRRPDDGGAGDHGADPHGRGLTESAAAELVRSLPLVASEDPVAVRSLHRPDPRRRVRHRPAGYRVRSDSTFLPVHARSRSRRSGTAARLHGVWRRLPGRRLSADDPAADAMAGLHAGPRPPARHCRPEPRRRLPRGPRRPPRSGRPRPAPARRWRPARRRQPVLWASRTRRATRARRADRVLGPCDARLGPDEEPRVRGARRHHLQLWWPTESELFTFDGQRIYTGEAAGGTFAPG